jgi:hypothetical protein
LDGFAEPGGSDTVTCLWFEEIMFNHNNGLSPTRERQTVPTDARELCAFRNPTMLALQQLGGLRPHNATGHKIMIMCRGT